MTNVEIKYAFPLFTKHNSTDYLIKHDQIRVSDIWSFWQYLIERYVKKYSGEKNFLQTLIEQAQYFYEAAERAPLRSKPLLYYYSFLNFVKVVINVNSLSVFGSTKDYNHGVDAIGMSTGATMKDLKIRIKSLIPQPIQPTNKVSVDYQFMLQMGDPLTAAPLIISIDDLLKNCIGIHRTYCETSNCKETYYKVDHLELYKKGHVFYSKYHIPKCNTEIQTDLTRVGYNITSEATDDGSTEYFWEESIILPSDKPKKLGYYILSEKLRKKGIWYFTDGNIYKTYISKDPLHISTESIIYNLMFFFGSITRYHPYLFDKMLTEKQMWLVGEFLKTQPKQFLHIVTSKTIESAVIKPDTMNIVF